jgi:hypothetical protein
MEPRPDTCGTCAYYDAGTCHRRPPWALDGTAASWPATAPADWCGEHIVAAPPSPTTREQALAKELLHAGQSFAIMADELQGKGGMHRLFTLATTASRHALAAAGRHLHG